MINFGAATMIRHGRGREVAPHFRRIRSRARVGSRFEVERLEDRVVLSSLWNSSVTPGTASWEDPAAVEVGVKFHSDVAG